MVSVTSLWADERMYWPVHFEPYTPAHHFEQGKKDPEFRTKLGIAVGLVERAVAIGIPFRAVVADSFYGDDEGFKQGLRKLRVGYVLALKPSHSWWHWEGEVGSIRQVARGAGWKGAKSPGKWRRVERRFRDGHTEEWWALEVIEGPYGPERMHRAFVVSTDPEELPEIGTWYLATNLPSPGSERASEEDTLPAASLEEVVRLYGLRMWIEQKLVADEAQLGLEPVPGEVGHSDQAALAVGVLRLLVLLVQPEPLPRGWGAAFGRRTTGRADGTGPRDR